MSNKNFMAEYMNKKFNYGGIMTTRVDIIRDLQKKTTNQRLISSYLMGLEYKEKYRYDRQYRQ